MRNLVVAPAGTRSLHRSWMGDPATRSYDVWLNAYDEGALAAFARDPVAVHDARGTMKWQGIARLLEAREAELARYGAVWFPDDDVAIEAPAVERLFGVVRTLGLWLAQPALAEGSYFSVPATLEHRTFFARYTNFVEVMAPLFSAEALARCRPTFSESVSGWGLDRVWSRVLGDPRDRIAVLDAVAMRHVSPVGAAGWYARLAVTPKEEEARVARAHGVPLPFVLRQYAGIPLEAGPRPDAAIPAGPALLWRMARGAPRSQRWRGRFWRRQWRSVWAGARAR